MNILKDLKRKIRLLKVFRFNQKILYLLQDPVVVNSARFEDIYTNEKKETHYMTIYYTVNGFEISKFQVDGSFASYTVFKDNLQLYSFVTRFGIPLKKDVDIGLVDSIFSKKMLQSY